MSPSEAPARSATDDPSPVLVNTCQPCRRGSQEVSRSGADGRAAKHAIISMDRYSLGMSAYRHGLVEPGFHHCLCGCLLLDFRAKNEGPRALDVGHLHNQAKSSLSNAPAARGMSEQTVLSAAR